MPPPFGVFFGRADQLLDPAYSGEPEVTRVDIERATVSLLDLGLIRGDGIFEATTIADNVPLAWGLHLARLVRSADAMELPTPNVEALQAFTIDALRLMGSTSHALLKLVVTRGDDPSLSRSPRDAAPTVFALIDAGAARREIEIEIVTLEREVFRDSAERAPWLLLGVKTLSYAMNVATRREFERRGSQNGVYVSRDGLLMEGPQSSIVLREGNHLITPDPRIGILHGTTQRELFAWAELNGFDTRYEYIAVDRLYSADQVWMMGSSTLQSVRAVDGRPIANDLNSTVEINRFLRTERAVIEARTAEPNPLQSPETSRHAASLL